MDKERIKENILTEALGLFTNYGLRSVTMDDIASKLGISKKTIYQHFKDKEEIIIQVTQMVFDVEHQKMLELEENSENAVDHLYQQTQWLRDRIKNTSNAALYDMRKYYLNAWEKYRCFKRDVIYQSVIRNLNRGIKEGLFREDLHPEILALLRIGEIELSFNKEIFPDEEYSLVEIHEQFFRHFTYGILSAQGLKLFEQYMKKEDK